MTADEPPILSQVPLIIDEPISPSITGQSGRSTPILQSITSLSTSLPSIPTQVQQTTSKSTSLPQFRPIMERLWEQYDIDMGTSRSTSPLIKTGSLKTFKFTPRESPPTPTNIQNPKIITTTSTRTLTLPETTAPTAPLEIKPKDHSNSSSSQSIPQITPPPLRALDTSRSRAEKFKEIHQLAEARRKLKNPLKPMKTSLIENLEEHQRIMNLVCPPLETPNIPIPKLSKIPILSKSSSTSKLSETQIPTEKIRESVFSRLGTSSTSLEFPQVIKHPKLASKIEIPSSTIIKPLRKPSEIRDEPTPSPEKIIGHARRFGLMPPAPTEEQLKTSVAEYEKRQAAERHKEFEKEIKEQEEHYRKEEEKLAESFKKQMEDLDKKKKKEQEKRMLQLAKEQMPPPPVTAFTLPNLENLPKENPLFPIPFPYEAQLVTRTTPLPVITSAALSGSRMPAPGSFGQQSVQPDSAESNVTSTTIEIAPPRFRMVRPLTPRHRGRRDYL